jgi:XisH protein
VPARDIYHESVRAALVKDGWVITHDPLRLEWGAKDVFIDLGAERLLWAEREGEKIAVEIKSFVGKSDIDDLEKALGQYILYHDVLAERQPERTLYLAVHVDVFHNLFEEPIGELLLKNSRFRLLVFDARTEEVLEWIH